MSEIVRAGRYGDRIIARTVPEDKLERFNKTKGRIDDIIKKTYAEIYEILKQEILRALDFELYDCFDEDDVEYQLIKYMDVDRNKKTLTIEADNFVELGLVIREVYRRLGFEIEDRREFRNIYEKTDVYAYNGKFMADILDCFSEENYISVVIGNFGKLLEYEKTMTRLYSELFKVNLDQQEYINELLKECEETMNKIKEYILARTEQIIDLFKQKINKDLNKLMNKQLFVVIKNTSVDDFGATAWIMESKDYMNYIRLRCKKHIIYCLMAVNLKDKVTYDLYFVTINQTAGRIKGTVIESVRNNRTHRDDFKTTNVEFVDNSIADIVRKVVSGEKVMFGNQNVVYTYRNGSLRFSNLITLDDIKASS